MFSYRIVTKFLAVKQIRKYATTRHVPALKGGPLAQPHWSTHSHLIEKGYGTRSTVTVSRSFLKIKVQNLALTGDVVTPGLRLEDYQRRRRTLMQAFDKEATMLLIPSATLPLMSNDIPYEFRQNSDFAYLCGLEEPDALLALIGIGEETTEQRDREDVVQSVLFLRARNVEREMWDGPRCGPERAVEHFGVSAAHCIDDGVEQLRRLARYVTCVEMVEAEPAAAPSTMKLIESAFGSSPVPSVGRDRLRGALDRCRLVKSDAEVLLLQRAADVAADAFNDTIRSVRVNQTEHEVCARLDYECRRRGGRRLSFPPVGAGGRNALTLHYIANTALLRDDDLMLLDGGTEYNNYCSDITRTFPVARRFTPAQRDVYERVLSVNEACIRMLAHADSTRASEQELSMLHVHSAARYIIANHLVQLGLGGGKSADTCLQDGTVDRFFPHSIGHWLGMDTHDTPRIPMSTALRDGHVVTIEPGIYIPDDDASIPAELRGIGIRVEDDVVVRGGSQLPLVLTERAVKSVDELESLRAET